MFIEILIYIKNVISTNLIFVIIIKDFALLPNLNNNHGNAIYSNFKIVFANHVTEFRFAI